MRTPIVIIIVAITSLSCNQKRTKDNLINELKYKVWHENAVLALKSYHGAKYRLYDSYVVDISNINQQDFDRVKDTLYKNCMQLLPDNVYVLYHIEEGEYVYGVFSIMCFVSDTCYSSQLILEPRGIKLLSFAKRKLGNSIIHELFSKPDTNSIEGLLVYTQISDTNMKSDIVLITNKNSNALMKLMSF